MYELAAEEEQRYKEAKVILEKALVREKDGLQEMRYVEWMNECAPNPNYLGQFL